MSKENSAKENKSTASKRRKQTWFDVCLKAGDRFMKNKMWRDAIEAYSALERVLPGNTYIYDMRGLCFLNNGMPEEAVEDLSASIRIDPTNPDTYNKRGAGYSMIGMHREALLDYNEAIILNPDEARFYANRGLCCLELDDACQAVANFDKAISLDVKNELDALYLYRGEAHSCLGNYKLAVEDFNRELELHPLNMNAFASRMLVLGMMDNDKANS